MRKSIYLIGLAVMVLFGAGCSKGKGNGTTRAYAPDSCFNGANNGYANNGYGNNGYGNNGYSNNGYNNNGYQNTGYNGGGYNSGGYNNNNQGYINNGQYTYGQRYQFQNGQCVDTRNNQYTIVSPSLCQNIQYSNNANCTNYGYGNGTYQGQVQGAYNACSVYNTAAEQFYPVYYANLGVTVCAGYSAFSTLYGAGIPAFYPGYSNVFQGCIPGVTGPGRCACNSFGGRLGWFSAGIQLGVCY